MTNTEKQIRCAEILGWKRNGRLFERDGEIRTLLMSSVHKGLPAYLTDANAALELIDWMRKKGWRSEINAWRNEWSVDVDPDEKWFRVCAPTFFQAVVDAFLQANGVEL